MDWSLVIIVLLFLVRVGPNQLNRGLFNIYLQFGMQISCVELLFKSFSGSKKKGSASCSPKLRFMAKLPVPSHSFLAGGCYAFYSSIHFRGF